MPAEDGTLVFRAPKWGGKEDVPFVAVGNDYGDIVHGILLEPERWNGKLVQAVSDVRSFDEMTQAFEVGMYMDLFCLRGKEQANESSDWQESAF